MITYPTAPVERLDPSLAVEAFSRSSIVITVTIPANGVLPYPVYGESFYFLGATAPIEAKTDKTSYKPYRKGTGENFPAELRFTRLEIKNDNAFAVQVTLWAGFGQYIDNRFEIVDTFTSIQGWVSSQINAGASAIFTGAPVGSQIQRKAIVVSNIDANNTLVIRDKNNNFCCAVFPNTSITLPISGEVRVFNPTGANIQCYVSEVWYEENAL
jgi:hypothetical protein